MPTENHIIIDKGTTLHPETNSNQVYDYVRGKWVQEVITDIMNKPTTWTEVQNKPTEFAPSAHTHATSDIRGLDADLQRLNTAIENVKLPIATTEVLGGIKPDGTTITVDPVNGIASAAVGIEEEWIPITPENGWETGTVVNHNALMYYKDSTGRVYLRGEARKASAANIRMFTLPVGYRATTGSTYSAYCHANGTSNTLINVEIGFNSDGAVIVSKPALSEIERVFLDISFRPI